VLKGIDVYGTTRVDVAWVKDHLGDKIDRLVATEDEAEHKQLKTEITDAIRAQYKDLGWVELSGITYFKPEGQQAYVTIDVVEKRDLRARRTFRAPPTGDPEDPAGLLAAWKEYEALFFTLLRAGQITPVRVECPAFHCIGGYEHEKFKPFGERFLRDVPPNEARLIRVLREDKDGEDRATAAFLLAHIHDGKKLVALMLSALDDPSSLTRNNATRVLVDVARHHPELAIPLPPILHLLDGPTTTDRNKAVAVLSGLVARPDGAKLHRQVIQQAGPTLLKLLALEQPNNHDFAYQILKDVSGRDFGERDIAAWQQWLRAQH
jgi:hypothetical protein